MHTVCLIWAHSEQYSRPARIIVILQEICNLFIDMVFHISLQIYIDINSKYFHLKILKEI